MPKRLVSLVKYEKPFDSVARAVELCKGLDGLPSGATVFVKPNILRWTKEVVFPKWGVITTSRVVEDVVRLLKDHGAGRIIIGEGMVLGGGGHRETAHHAFQSLGYFKLKERYGAEPLNVFERPFREVGIGEGMTLSYAVDALESDFLVDLPVMKTHVQTVVSLGTKNLKGLIDVKSRKRCHNPDPEHNLHWWVSRLPGALPPALTVIDGLFTSERGPSFDGRMRRDNLLVASADILSADLVGSSLLGHAPADVPHLANAARAAGRRADLSEVEVVGENVGDHARPHEYTFPYNEDGSLPLPLDKMGVKGLSFYKFDSTMCTYCSGINGVVLQAVAAAWKGGDWGGVEVLTGKKMQPRPGARATVLLGKCMHQAHKDNPEIQRAIPVKGCPPQPEQIVKALHEAGIPVDPAIFQRLDSLPGDYMKRYKDKPEFDENLFRVA